ncbi:hypothetical protein OAG56_04455 [Mariniblastus sp.]|nr:hypothetical protein [Mariniblastus sp.]MDB4756603.1 hypothetical protein [Mariniblastus sp.]
MINNGNPVEAVQVGKNPSEQHSDYRDQQDLPTRPRGVQQPQDIHHPLDGAGNERFRENTDM